MSLYVMADFHLCFGANDKPMDIFGKKWEGYMEKIENSCKILTEEDTIVIPGDISWATYLSSCVEDLKFIDALPGRKIISKGNHDYWWTTMKKHEKWCDENGFDSIKFLHNNYYMYKDVAICGTRGWQLTSRNEEDLKVYNREKERLIISLKLASAQSPSQIIVALHYPPDSEFKQIMEEYNVGICLFGHLHAAGFKDYSDYDENGISYRLVSCDYLQFKPYKIMA